MATPLSTLKVNQISARSLATEIKFLHDIDLNGKELKNAVKITTNEIMAPAATALKAGLMAAGDKAKLDNIEAQADVTDATNVHDAGAIMETDFSGNEGYLRRTQLNPMGEFEYELRTDVYDHDHFQTKIGYVKSDGTGNLITENATFLTQNQPILLKGQITGSSTIVGGQSEISASLEIASITGQPQFSSVDADKDRILVAIDVGMGNFQLGQVSPKVLGATGGGGGSTIGAFNSGQGIGRKSGETGVTVTLEPNAQMVSLQTLQYAASTPYISGSDQILLAKTNGQLAKTTNNELGTWIATNFTSGSGGGGGSANVLGLAVKFEIDADGNLVLAHTGGLTDSNFYINTDSELVADVT